MAEQRLEDASGPIPLQPKAFEILKVLIGRRGHLVLKDQLLDEVWPDTHVADGVLKVRMAEIRGALRDSARAPRIIETVHRRGYRFIADVTVAEPTTARPAGASARQFSTPFVGRARELELLEGHLARALDGERQVVFVTGEPGIGKTEVVERFLAAAAEPQALAIARGQCLQQFGAAEAYMPVLEAVGRLARDVAPARSLLRGCAPTWLAQLPWLVDDDERDRLGRELLSTGRDRMLREMGEFVEALTAEIPLVLVLEDLHWSDPSTVDLVSLLAGRREPARMLLVATYRPVELILAEHPLRGVAQRLAARQQSTELALAELDAEAVAEYLEGRFVGGRFASEVARLLRERTDGNPLFLVALVERLLARGTIVERGGGWEVGGGLREELADIPESLALLIEQQLERLPPEDRELLEGGSLAGVEFSAAAAAAATGGDPGAVEERCARVARAGRFLHDVGEAEWPDGTVARRYAFRHALYREMLAAKLLPRRRAEVHLRIGRALERAYGDRSPELGAELAVHFEEGGDRARAARYRRSAAETAARRHAFAEAETHLERGLALVGGLPASPERDREELLLQSTLGPVLRATRGYAAPEVERAYTRALELSERTPQEPPAFPVLLGLWALYAVRAELDRALELAERNRAIAEASQDRLMRLQAHHTLWVTHFFRGELLATLRHLDEGERLCDPREDSWSVLIDMHDPKIDALCHRSLVLWLLGHVDQALKTSLQVLEHARALGYPLSLAHAMYCVTWVRFLRRELQASREVVEALNAYLHEHELPYWKALTLQMHGWVIAGQGELERGISSMEEGLALFTAIGSRLGLTAYCAYLAEARMRAGALAEARQMLERCKALVAETGERFYEAEIYRLDGELVLAEAGGAHAAPAEARERAERLLHDAIECASRQGARMLELRAATTLAGLCGRGAKGTQARARLADLLASFTEGFDTPDLQDAKALLEELR